MDKLKWYILSVIAAALFIPPIFSSQKIIEITPVLVQDAIPVAKAQEKPIEAPKITSVWDGYAQLKRIASCESWGDPNKEPREFDEKGKVLRGVPDSTDIGMGQIHLSTWGKKAKELGYDIFTYEGNLAMTKWIYDHDPRHEKNWSASKNCWK